MSHGVATFLDQHFVLALAVSTFIVLALILGALHETALILSVLRVFVRALKQHLLHVAREVRGLWAELTTWRDSDP
ncbi:MAG TPA: hypothetical protein VGQ65_11655 [Thermoanaerobaculia bacterium]|jgi:hypothetical protein|nr:hypothetical protein [Thermoanaerobaculia bacterium]